MVGSTLNPLIYCWLTKLPNDWLIQHYKILGLTKLFFIFISLLSGQFLSQFSSTFSSTFTNTALSLLDFLPYTFSWRHQSFTHISNFFQGHREDKSFRIPPSVCSHTFLSPLGLILFFSVCPTLQRCDVFLSAVFKSYIICIC